MSKDKGYIKTYRAMFATEMWNEPRTLSRFEAWLDILRRTWYADAEQQPVSKGEFMASLRGLASDWGWTVDSVLRFINRLLNAGMIAKTDKPSVYKVRNTERNIMRYNTCNTKRNTKIIEEQELADETATPSATPSATVTATPSAIPHLIIDKKEIDNKEKEACACAGPSVAPPAPATLPDGTPLPYGMTLRQWERFRSWAEKNVPTLMEVGITPTDYAIMRGKALSDVKKVATILLAMEKAGRPHRVRDEYIRRVERWREDKFNGLYG